jgi:hypothetical protein
LAQPLRRCGSRSNRVPANRAAARAQCTGDEHARREHHTAADDNIQRTHREHTRKFLERTDAIRIGMGTSRRHKHYVRRRHATSADLVDTERIKEVFIRSKTSRDKNKDARTNAVLLRRTNERRTNER